ANVVVEPVHHRKDGTKFYDLYLPLLPLFGTVSKHFEDVVFGSVDDHLQVGDLLAQGGDLPLSCLPVVGDVKNPGPERVADLFQLVPKVVALEVDGKDVLVLELSITRLERLLQLQHLDV